MSLPQRLRSYLKVRAARRGTTTYRDLAKALELDPPNAIHRVTEALEVLMHEDHEDGAPLIAALVVSKARSGVPAPGFFTLGAFAGRLRRTRCRAGGRGRTTPEKSRAPGATGAANRHTEPTAPLRHGEEAPMFAARSAHGSSAEGETGIFRWCRIRTLVNVAQSMQRSRSEMSV